MGQQAFPDGETGIFRCAQRFFELFIDNFSIYFGMKDDTEKHDAYNFLLLFRISLGEGIH